MAGTGRQCSCDPQPIFAPSRYPLSYVRYLLPLLLLTGCWPTAGELPIRPINGDDDDGPAPGPACTLRDLDDTELPNVVEGTDYSGRVLVEGYDGDATFSIAQGSMPPGLTLADTGAVSGMATTLGEWEVWIRVVDMTIADALGCVAITVTDLPKDAFLGYVHDQRTYLTENEGVQVDLWVRIAEGGEDGQDEVLLRPGIYQPGPDGVNDQGGGDDELVRLLDPSEVTIEPDLWVNADAEPDLDPSTYEGDGLFVAGVDTGELPFTLSHPDFEPVDSKLQVIPPDWCPDGLSSGPGDGSCE